MHKQTSSKAKSLLDACIKDRRGRVVLFQSPNVPILLWIVFTMLGMFLHGSPKTVAGYIAFGSLFTWAWLEITAGATYFRRALGVVVLFASLVGKL